MQEGNLHKKTGINNLKEKQEETQENVTRKKRDEKDRIIFSTPKRLLSLLLVFLSTPNFSYLNAALISTFCRLGSCSFIVYSTY